MKRTLLLTALDPKFAGLFPRIGWEVGEVCTAASELAMDEINARADLLPNTVLKGHFREKLPADDPNSLVGSKVGQMAGQFVTEDMCDGKMGVNVLVQQVKRHPEIGGVLGSGCSGVCRPVSMTAAGFRIPVVSWGCSSPSLSDSVTYPWFTRLCHTEAAITVMLTEYLDEKQSLDKVGMLGDDSPFCHDMMDQFKSDWRTASQENVLIGGAGLGEMASEVTYKQGTLTLDGAVDLLKRMSEKNVKVFITCGWPVDDPQIKKAAPILGLSREDSNFMFSVSPPPPACFRCNCCLPSTRRGPHQRMSSAGH
jgi:hypothetical protein